MADRDRPRVLVLVQAVDEQEPLMGFFVSWIREFSQHAQGLVCALRVSDPPPPIPGVHIYPLRRRGSLSRWEVIWNILRLSWTKRHEYEAVFARGDSIYVVLFGWLWRLLGKRVVLWYAHVSESFWLRPAAWFSSAVVTSVRGACALVNAVPIGQGVDVARFSKCRNHSESSPSFLIFGRVSPVKRVGWMLSEIERSLPELANRIHLYGRATHASEQEAVGGLVARMGCVWKQGDVAVTKSPELYLTHDVYLNATQGSLDKTIVEAMLSGLVVIATTPGYGEGLPDELRWLQPADEAFVAAVARAAALSSTERAEIGRRLREIARARHSQSQQIREVLRLLQAGGRHGTLSLS